MDQNTFNAGKKAVLISVGLYGLTGALAGFLHSYSKTPTLEQQVIPLDRSSFPSLPIVDPLNERPLSLESPYIPYTSFKRTEELDEIKLHAQRLGVSLELIMAIRSAENGGPGKEYGIIPEEGTESALRYANDTGYFLEGTFRTYTSEREKQLAWAARTIEKNLVRFKENPLGHPNFISFLAARYAPNSASNDPHDLNAHWESNVGRLYETFNAEKPR